MTSVKPRGPAPLVRLRLHLGFSLLVVLLTCGLVVVSLCSAPAPESPGVFLYELSVLGYYCWGLLVVWLVLCPLALSGPSSLVPLLLQWAWLTFMAADAVVFKVYGYHLNFFVLRVVLMDFGGLGAPGLPAAAFALAALALLALLWLARRWFYRRVRASAKPYFLALALATLLFGANSLAHIWAEACDRQEITSLDGYLPLYAPFVSERLAPGLSRNFPSLFPPERGRVPETAGRGNVDRVRYPAGPLEFDNDAAGAGAGRAAGRPPDITLIVLESWQAAAMTPEITPSIHEFSRGAHYFRNHVSSGSTTVPGVFGLFFGLQPGLYDLFKNSPLSNQSVLTARLAEMGYELRVFSGNNLDRFQLRTLIFPGVEPGNFHVGPDESLVDAYMDSLDLGSGAPRFDFIFIFAPHSPYASPAAFAKFQPVPKAAGGYVFNSRTDPLPYRNAYRNSLSYADHLAGRILDGLAARGRYDGAIIVVTGDHAEEFNENGLGYWGHGSNFSRWQTATPMILKTPGQREGRTIDRRSLHADLVPTLMEEALGCVSSPELYSHGQNLLTIPETRDAAMGSYFDQAYLIGDTVLERLRHRRYKWGDMAAAEAVPGEGARVRELFERERRFLGGRDD
ncbi:MAG: sulfatase-like hydrolase/transferase [Deltaproteobacteria bacterium]|jgi:membrane-anchored protein YejM (alkaline phosphatase superfamily)|nr:sulfatase-like hydrolase/transferase [Deltaproteobacteria bacterium]